MRGGRTRLVEDEMALAALEPAWWELWRNCPTATPFQSPAWLLAWLHVFAPGPLRTVAAFRDGQLAGLFPFYFEEATGRLLPLGISLSDYFDVLAIDDAAAEAMADAMRSFCWTAWSFEEMPPAAAALGLARLEGTTQERMPQSACPVLSLSGGSDLAGCVPARRRRQFRRARAAAARCGPVRILRVEHQPDAFLDALLALHAARWHGRDEPGLLADARVQQFHREALPAMARAGLARCTTLAIGGHTVAAYYGFAHRHASYAYLGGFDPAFEAASPGAILIGEAIIDAMHEGASEFHFLRGRESYKYTWGAIDRWNQRMTWIRSAGHV